jgi:hemerythrin-like domain-containing protein
MPTRKTMNVIIHAALRRDLARFDEALNGFSNGYQNRADQLSAAWDNLEHQLHQHHRDEETIFFPACRELGADESLIGDLDGEHTGMLTALDAASTSMRALRSSPSAGNARAARAAVAELNAILRDHLAHEERDLEPFAARHARTPQMKTAVAAVRKAHKGNAGMFFAWLTDGAEPDTTRALRRVVPPPVLFLTTRVGGRHYHRRIASAWT